MIKNKIVLYGFGVIGGFLAVMIYCLLKLPGGLLTINYLDVGQGDSILISLPDGSNVLVDGGPDEKVLQQLADVLPFYENTIDLVILTHPHPDHINGLIEVFKRYKVGAAAMTGINYNLPAYIEFLDVIGEKNINLQTINGGQDFRIGDVIFDFVYPVESFEGRTFTNVNNSSIVFRLIYGREKFIFMGDLEMDGEAKLLASGEDIRAEVLKVGHHGSRTATSFALLDAAKPLAAVIMCSAGNKYLHPHPETMTALKKIVVKIYRSDLDGRVEFKTDGKSLWNGWNIFPTQSGSGGPAD
jgi:competence protein ComEC